MAGRYALAWPRGPVMAAAARWPSLLPVAPIVSGGEIAEASCTSLNHKKSVGIVPDLQVITALVLAVRLYQAQGNLAFVSGLPLVHDDDAVDALPDIKSGMVAMALVGVVSVDKGGDG